MAISGPVGSGGWVVVVGAGAVVGGAVGAVGVVGVVGERGGGVVVDAGAGATVATGSGAVVVATGTVDTTDDPGTGLAARDVSLLHPANVARARKDVHMVIAIRGFMVV
jgi:hypothetical protein